jgi:DNA gyrase subunit A
MVMPTRRERVVARLIEEEMRQSFLDYSMSVIVQRALPDVRDGLKPVHRRILYAMQEAGLAAGRPYKKSATVVGDVLGKYHPHGDMAVYDALVRMVQDFSLRYPLIDGQGNFGSVDGDNAAAYRYTEVRLTRLAGELLADIDKDTVAFASNFDDRLREPTLLPAKFPNLLVNGSSGIAVGMATNVPPHNLKEVATAVKYLIAHPKATIEQLMRHVPGPDFPTGAFILGVDGIREAYETGRGRIVMRAAVRKETRRGGRERLVVTALPYGVSKTKVIEQIAELVRASKAEGIADLRDESDRDGMRIVIELKRDARVPQLLATLYRQTHLQSTFGAILLALDHGVPREFNLKELLERFREHRLDVIRRRTRHELEQAKAEAHVIDGLLIALDRIDAVIRVIRKAADPTVASIQLRAKFDLSETQAKAILDMRLARLTALEQKELDARLKELRKRIRELDAILKSEPKQLQVLVAELDETVKQFVDARRTTIVSESEEVEVEDLEAEEQVVITLSHESYIKRVPMSLYQKRVARGRALVGMDKHAEDFLEHVFVANSTETLLFFTDRGQVHAVEVRDVPESSATSRGRSLAQVLPLEKGARVAALVAVGEFDEKRALVFLTANGTIKRTGLDAFANVKASGIAAIKLQDDDSLLDVQLSEGGDVVLVTREGRAIRFPDADAPLLGRATQGVRGIQLREGDAVVGMVIVRREATLCTVTTNGYAKRTPLTDYPVQKRGGIGTITLDVSKKTGPLIAALEVLPGDELMVISASGRAARITADDIPVQGRATQGKHLSGFDDDAVVEVARVARETEQEGEPENDKPTRRGKTKQEAEPDDKPKRRVKTKQKSEPEKDKPKRRGKREQLDLIE